MMSLAALADIAVEEPLNGTVELAGPEAIRMDELADISERKSRYTER